VTAELKSQIEAFLLAAGVEYDPKRKSYRCPNPNHADERASAHLYRDSNRLYCPVCAEKPGWDVFDVAGFLTGEKEFPKLREYVERMLGTVPSSPTRQAATAQKPRPKKPPVALHPDRAKSVYTVEEFQRRASMAGWGTFASSWEYRDANGIILAVDVRFERDAAGPSVVQEKTVVTFWFDGRELRTQGAPVLVYGLDRLAAHPELPVLVVEGCKTAEAASAIPGFVVVTWSGGTGKIDLADWSPLSERTVYIWPDDDQKNDKKTGELKSQAEQPGIKAAMTLAKRLPRARIIVPPPRAREIKPDGADAVEALQVYTPAELAEYIRTYILGAPETVAEPTGASGPIGREWAKRLLVSDSGNPKLALGNMLLIFQHDEDWHGVIAFNLRTQNVVFRRRPPEDIRAEAGDVLTDEHVSRATIWLQDTYGFAIRNTGIVFAAMTSAANLVPFDPVQEWLEALPTWDGTPRLSTWLPRVTGCSENVYTESVGRVTLIAAVARVYTPGCKVDTVLVLHGPQGTLKSTLLAELAGRPEWFSDHISDIGGKDACLQLCGPWILEFSELDAITGKRESERVKSWITQQRDRFRPPYGRSMLEIPRRTIFCGTSNLHQFLRDETGGRRFLPIEIREIDLEVLRGMRDQLWAEARAMFLMGEKWWLEGAALEQAKVEQEDRRVADPWEQAIREWLTTQAARGPFVTSSQVLTKGIGMELPRQGKSDLDRCGRILGTVLGWTRGTRRVDGVPMKVWYRPRGEDEPEVVDLPLGGGTAPEASRQPVFGGMGDW
jgi:putative DNA primase/helicase